MIVRDSRFGSCDKWESKRVETNSIGIVNRCKCQKNVKPSMKALRMPTIPIEWSSSLNAVGNVSSISRISGITARVCKILVRSVKSNEKVIFLTGWTCLRRCMALVMNASLDFRKNSIEAGRGPRKIISLRPPLGGAPSVVSWLRSSRGIVSWRLSLTIPAMVCCP